MPCFRFLPSPTLLLSLCTGLAPAAALAQAGQPSSSFLSLGVGVAAQRQPYAGAGTKSALFPFVAYDGERLRFAGDTVDLKLTAPGSWTFAVRGRYALLDGYKASDAAVFSGMDDREGSIWLGGAAVWNADFARVSMELLGDTMGKSKGLQGRLAVERDFHSGAFTFTPRLGVRYMDKKYVDYYYGVKASEATTYRAAYTGSSTASLQVGLRGSYAINAKSSMFADINITSFGKGITDSPLVDKKVAPALAIGYLYRY